MFMKGDMPVYITKRGSRAEISPSDPAGHFFVLDFVDEDDDHNSNENQDFRFYPPELIL